MSRAVLLVAVGASSVGFLQADASTEQRHFALGHWSYVYRGYSGRFAILDTETANLGPQIRNRTCEFDGESAG
jgi:hypothetical protein